MRGSCTSRPIKALARPPRTPWEEAPARSPNPGKCTNEKSYGKAQGSAGEGRHGICGILGVSQEDTMEGPLWREILGRSLGSHDAAELVGGMCHGNGCRQETTRLYAISCTKTGWSSLTHNRVPYQALAHPFARVKSRLLLKIRDPSERELAGKTAD